MKTAAKRTRGAIGDRVQRILEGSTWVAAIGPQAKPFELLPVLACSLNHLLLRGAAEPSSHMIVAFALVRCASKETSEVRSRLAQVPGVEVYQVAGPCELMLAVRGEKLPEVRRRLDTLRRLRLFRIIHLFYGVPSEEVIQPPRPLVQTA